jgi:PAS domain S-box-containing protein
MAKQSSRTSSRTSRNESTGGGGSAQKRPTLGLFIDSIMAGYQNALFHGVDDVARERDVNLLCFVGGSLHPADQPADPSNALYDLLDEDALDGLIVAAGVVGTLVGLEEMQSFCERFRHLPQASIALPIAGVPSILMDNYAGMRAVVEHLVDGHGYRRIAFFHKQEGHPESDARYNAYVDVLTERGIAVDPNLVVPGTYYLTPAASIKLLFEERQLRPGSDVEAMVANDDSLALQILDLLRMRGIRVPTDVAVVGFDDVEDSRYVMPALTTARQPLHMQARRAAELVLAQLQGDTVAPQVILQADLLVRRSCGCLDEPVRRAQVETKICALADPALSFDMALTARREALLADMVQAIVTSNVDTLSDGQIRAQAGGLVNAFITTLKALAAAASTENFLWVLDDILRQTVANGRDVMAWQDALTVLRQYVLACTCAEADVLQAENLLQQARVMIGSAAQQAQASRRLQAGWRDEILRNIGENLITALTVEELVQALTHDLARLDIPGSYISLFVDQQAPAAGSRLIMAYDRGRELKSRIGERFSSRQLVPAGLFPGDRRYSMMVVSLNFRRVQLGRALFEIGPREGLIYDVLRIQISSALQGALITERLAGRAVQLQTAAEVSRAASAVLDPASMIHEVVTLVRDRFNLYYAGLFLIEPDPADPDMHWAVLQAGSGEAGKQMVEQRHRLPVGGASMIGWCVANRQARIALDVERDAVRRPHPLLPDTRSELALPLISRGNVIGALTIQSVQEGAFTPEDITVLQTLADQLANAITNARLYEALEFEQYLMNVLMDTVPDNIYFKDRASRFLRVSRSISDRFGLSDPREAVGKSDFDYFTEEHARPAYEDEQRIIRTGEPLLGLEERETWKDRPDTWVSTIKMPLYDRDGNITGTFGISHDISERKRIEMALAEERNLLRTLIDNLPDYIYIKDRQSRFIVNNSAHLRLLGAETQEEVVGKTDFDSFPYELALQYYTDEQNLMAAGEALIDREEPVADQTTGQTLWVSSTKVPLRAADGQIIGFVGMTRDITGRRRTENVLRRRDRQLQTVADVARVASEVMDLEVLLRQAMELLREQLDLYYAGLFLVDMTEAPAAFASTPRRRWAVLRAGTGAAGAQMAARRHRLEVGGNSMIGQCVATGEARIALDVGAEAVRFDNPLLPETRSELALPLRSRGGVIGAVTIQSAEEAAFGQEDVAVLQALADQLANAIENIRLFEQTQSALRDLEMVQRQYVRETWSGQQAATLLKDYEVTRPGIAPLVMASALPEVRETLTRQSVVTLSGGGQEADYTALVAPISLRDEVIGALGIHDEDKERRWTEDEIALVETIAERMGIVAETLRLLEETQHTAVRERLTRQITDQIRGAFTVDEAIQRALQQLGDALQANMVARIDIGQAARTPEERGKS